MTQALRRRAPPGTTRRRRRSRWARPTRRTPSRARRVEIGWWRTHDRRRRARSSGSTTARGDTDRSTMADLVSGLGARSSTSSPPRRSGGIGAAALRAGYVDFLQVVAAEWRPPRAIDDRDDLRRLRVFADVRGNDAVLRRAATAARADGRRSGRGRDRALPPGLVRARPRRWRTPAVYRPFLEAQPPRDVHPALLLGAFRNFQAKLLAAWSRAAAARAAPARHHRPGRSVRGRVPRRARRQPRASSWSRPMAPPRCPKACAPTRRPSGSSPSWRC